MLDDRGFVDQQGGFIPSPIISSGGSSVLTGNEAISNQYKNYGMEDIIDSWQKAASNGDVTAQEKLFNYYASEASAKTARDWTAEREDSQYQRLMVDLQKAGISPYVLTGATPASSSASTVSHSGSQLTSRENSDTSKDSTIKSALLRLMALGLIAVSRII